MKPALARFQCRSTCDEGRKENSHTVHDTRATAAPVKSRMIQCRIGASGWRPLLSCRSLASSAVPAREELITSIRQATPRAITGKPASHMRTAPCAVMQLREHRLAL
jgi:hypothetical protein